MATVERFIDATPEQVFALLADAPAYGRFVVGAKEVRTHDPAWPAKGTELHHTSGLGPLQVRDRTRVEAVDPPARLELLAGLRPLGQARVVFTLRPVGDGTLLRIEEAFASGPLRRLPAGITDRMIAARNLEVLRRVSEEVQQRIAPDAG